MASISYRRPSMIHIYDKLQQQSQDENAFDWLEDAAQQFPSDDKLSVTAPSYAPSPSNISSGSSSAASISSPTPDDAGSDSGSDDDDSDSDSDSSDSDIEPMTLDPNPYHIIDGHAYPESLLKGSIVDLPYLPLAPSPSPVPIPRDPTPVTEAISTFQPAQIRDPTPPMHYPTPPPAIAQYPFPRRSRQQNMFALWSRDSDQDADGETDGDASDDEYVPSPHLNPRKRAASPQQQSDTHQVHIAHAHAHSSRRRPTKRPRTSPPSRNIQVPVLPCSPSPTTSTFRKVGTGSKPLDFTCPECGWEQTNRRMPDFKRHLRTHTRPSDADQEQGWWCKGVPVEDAALYRLPHEAEPYLFLNQWRIGGCMRTFSRRDALKRHLDNVNVDCIGKPVFATDQ